MAISGTVPKVAVDRGKVFGESSQPPPPLPPPGRTSGSWALKPATTEMRGENEKQLRACTAPQGKCLRLSAQREGLGGIWGKGGAAEATRRGLWGKDGRRGISVSFALET